MATLGIVIAIVVYLAGLLIMGATFAKENHTVGVSLTQAVFVMFFGQHLVLELEPI